MSVYEPKKTQQTHPSPQKTPQPPKIFIDMQH